MSVSSKFKRPPRKVFKPQAAAVVEEEVEVEVEIEEDMAQRVLHSCGEFWVKYTCPKGDCKASFEVLTQGVLAIYCAACGAKMRSVVRRAEL